MKSIKIVNNRFGLIPEKLSEASPSRPACAECGLHENCTEPFIKPYVPEDWTGKYLFVTETSKEGELGYRRNGLPIGEREREQLKKILQTCNIARNDVAIVPVLRCRPILTGSKKPKMVNLRACRPFLIRAIGELNPEHVIAFGDSALKGVLNTGVPGPIALLRGRHLDIPVEGQEVFNTVEATSKLSSTLIDPHSITRITEDLRRTTLPLTSWPKKELPKC